MGSRAMRRMLYRYQEQHAGHMSAAERARCDAQALEAFSSFLAHQPSQSLVQQEIGCHENPYDCLMLTIALTSTERLT